MSEENQPPPILRRKVAPSPPPVVEDPEIDPTERRITTSVLRTADDGFGLTLRVASVRNGACDLDRVVRDVAPKSILISMCSPVAPLGCAILTSDLSAALIEVQTLGTLKATAALVRDATSTDALMVAPFVSMLAGDLSRCLPDVAATLDGLTTGARVVEPRKLLQLLSEVALTEVVVDVTFGDAKRTGQIHLLFPSMTAAEDQPVQTETTSWAQDLERSVLASEACVTAVLFRMSMTLGALEGLKAGEMLPLKGCTLSDIRLETTDGQCVASGRLGQSGGMRAVRIEPKPIPVMQDGLGKPPETAPLPDAPPEIEKVSA